MRVPGGFTGGASGSVFGPCGFSDFFAHSCQTQKPISRCCVSGYHTVVPVPTCDLHDTAGTTGAKGTSGTSGVSGIFIFGEVITNPRLKHCASSTKER